MTAALTPPPPDSGPRLNPDRWVKDAATIAAQASAMGTAEVAVQVAALTQVTAQQADQIRDLEQQLDERTSERDHARADVARIGQANASLSESLEAALARLSEHTDTSDTGSAPEAGSGEG